MATGKSLLNAIRLILLVAIDNAASGHYSGVLSNVYKKAAQENRPLILVLDNTKTSHGNGKARPSDYSYKTLDLSPKEDADHRSKSYSALDNHRDKDADQQPFLSSLLQTLNQQNSLSRHQYGKSEKQHDHSLTRSRPRDRDRLRLRSRSDHQDRWDRRDRQDKLRLRSRPNNRDRPHHHDRRDRLRLRSQQDRDARDRKDDRNYRDRRDERDGRDRRDERDRRDARDVRDNRNNRNRYDLDSRDHVRKNRDRRDRARYYRDRRDRDNVDNSIKAFIGKYQAARYPNEIERDEENDRTLRSSVVKHLLRISNDLNCDAQDECIDYCDDNYDKEKKADECADACGDKFKCEAEKDDRNEFEECDFADSCEESRETESQTEYNPSTRGVKFDA